MAEYKALHDYLTQELDFKKFPEQLTEHMINYIGIKIQFYLKNGKTIAELNKRKKITEQNLQVVHSIVENKEKQITKGFVGGRTVLPMEYFTGIPDNRWVTDPKGETQMAPVNPFEITRPALPIHYGDVQYGGFNSVVLNNIEQNDVKLTSEARDFLKGVVMEDIRRIIDDLNKRYAGKKQLTEKMLEKYISFMKCQ